MVKVISNDKYTVNPKAQADTQRYGTALTKVANKILSIGGKHDNTYLSSVSYYDIENDKWIGGLPQLKKARMSASACFHRGHAFVFCGYNDSSFFTSSY